MKILQKKIGYCILPVSCIFIVIALLTIGLWPMEFRPRNGIRWMEDTGGIQFSRMGVAFSKEPLVYGDEGIAIELLVESLRDRTRGVDVLLEIYKERESKWLVIGQWNAHLILRWSDSSGDSKKGFKELGLKGVFSKGGPRHLVVLSGKDGIALYVDGVLEKKSSRMLPFGTSGGEEGFLVLGNSASGESQWYGNLYRLSVYSSPDAAVSYEYPINESGGHVIKNSMGESGAILVPETFSVRERMLLRAPWRDFRLSLSYLVDVGVNLLGFIPLGFFLPFCLVRISGLDGKHVYLLSIIIGIALSLAIEITQSFIPVRSSSSTDLILNSMGTITGVILFRLIVKNGKMKDHRFL